MQGKFLQTEKNFSKIKEYFKDVDTKNINKGIFPMGMTSAGYFGTIPLDDVFWLFRKIRLDKKRSFADLGSGDGRICFTASLFCSAEGFELDERLYRQSLEHEQKLKSRTGRTCFHNKDFLHEDISGYDVLFINPDHHLKELEKKALGEGMKGKKNILIVTGKIYHPKAMKVKKEYCIETTHFSVY